MSQTAKRLNTIKPSASYAATQMARELKAKGVDIISLAMGEPDFPTPDHIVEAGIRALQTGATRYTDSRGTAELRGAVQRKFRRDNGLEFELDEIIVGPGAKAVVATALNATLDPGNEVIVPAPCWVSYADMVRLLNADPIIVECGESDALKLGPAALEAAITPRTRWLILNSPNNPSGAVYSAAELRALGEVLLRHPDVMVLSDEIYEHILFDGGQFVCFAACVPELRDRIVTVNGVSKAYAMTGWRIGYAAGPKWVIDAMAKVQSHTIGCSSTASQVAAVAALDGPQDIVARRTEEYQRRRDRAMALIDAVPGLKCYKPQGAFYLFVNWAGLIGKRTPDGKQLESDADLVHFLVAEGRVVVVPGEAFGMSPWFRVSVATALPALEEACARIAAAIAKLSDG